MPKVGDSKQSVRYLGIDPGASGGIASLWSDSAERSIYKMPDDDLDTWLLLEALSGPDTVAVIEKVQGFIGSGQPGSSMFKFGMGYGALKMALCAAQISYEEITPQVWQRGLGIPSRKKDESKGQWKARLKSKAEQLFPGTKLTLATADALLIALYCKRKHTGTLTR